MSHPTIKEYESPAKPKKNCFFSVDELIPLTVPEWLQEEQKEQLKFSKDMNLKCSFDYFQDKKNATKMLKQLKKEKPEIVFAITSLVLDD